MFMSVYQSTLRESALFVGKGLHTGRIVRMEVFPSAENTGIVFQRTDNSEFEPILAQTGNIASTELCMTIGSGPNRIATIEHLMAAFAGLGVDNALVKLNGPEVPIMDGSSGPFVKGLLKAGLTCQPALKKFLVVKKELEVKNGDQFIKVEPADALTIKCSIDYDRGVVIGRQSVDYRASLTHFLDIAKSRTFCHINDVNAMRQKGLALGGSLDNAVVVTDSQVVNREGLRDQNEFVKHKLLDLIGDLYLLGFPIVGKITVHKPGHTLHAQLMRELLKNGSDHAETVQPVGDVVGSMNDAQKNLAKMAAWAFG
ncbi:MAG: UDP-3-O-acyl-N-acetylglucosamine deacetylase [Oligoflexales bacterium]